MAASTILKNRKIAILLSRPRLERFRQNLARLGSSTLLTVLTVENWNFENPVWNLVCEFICIREFNIHLTEQHWQPVFLFSKPSVSIHVCCSYIELSRSKLHKTGHLQVGNWHVNCQHSVLFFPNSLFPTSAKRYFRNFSTRRGFTRKISAAMPIS